ncbi:MAG: hypothetical protein K9M07_03030 [Simkaniaceae bacterium]|nr:hypothetical protein [Simkaniaceae bacterium]
MNLLQKMICGLFLSNSFCFQCFTSGSTDIFCQFPNQYFIETGTYCGEGIRQALSTGKFEYVYSIEINKRRYYAAKKAFNRFSKVRLFLGDSASQLSVILDEVDAPATFWLDAHSAELVNRKTQDQFAPILREIREIGKHHIKNHSILIDDVRQFNAGAYSHISIENLKSALLEINPNYEFRFIDSPFAPKDILVAIVKR